MSSPLLLSTAAINFPAVFVGSWTVSLQLAGRRRPSPPRFPSSAAFSLSSSSSGSLSRYQSFLAAISQSAPICYPPCIQIIITSCAPQLSPYLTLLSNGPSLCPGSDDCAIFLCIVCRSGRANSLQWSSSFLAHAPRQGGWPVRLLLESFDKCKITHGPLMSLGLRTFCQRWRHWTSVLS